MPKNWLCCAKQTAGNLLNRADQLFLPTMSTQINENLLRELIKLSLKYGEGAGFGSKLTEKTIQKMLYELKRSIFYFFWISKQN